MAVTDGATCELKRQRSSNGQLTSPSTSSSSSMRPIKTVATVLAATIASTAVARSVTLYEDINFSGASFQLDELVVGNCYILNCFNDRASSVTWSNLPEDGYIDGRAVVAFYTDTKCEGDRKLWFTNEPNKPSNFVVDGINDAVSSLKVMQYETQKGRYKYTCPSAETEGVASSNTTTAMNTTSATGLSPLNATSEIEESTETKNTL